MHGSWALRATRAWVSEAVQSCSVSFRSWDMSNGEDSLLFMPVLPSGAAAGIATAIAIASTARELPRL